MMMGAKAAEKTKRTQKIPPRRRLCVYMRVRLQKKRAGLNRRSFCRSKETIRGFLFTSQRTQARVDPTAEEQSVEEIKKKEVRQHRVNMYPHRLIVPPAPGLTMHCGKCPNSLMPCQCPRCRDTLPLSNKHCSVSRTLSSGMSATSKTTLHTLSAF